MKNLYDQWRRKIYLIGVAISLLWTRRVPFVPSRIEVVREMLRIAEVGETDVLYDLGCGDGRICVVAAKEFGVRRAVGIDIDPRRVEEARMQARAAGVAAQTEFLLGDFTAPLDLKDATVVALFLLPNINLQIRQKLLKELRPGTRIVSNSFDMGHWQPDETGFVGWRKVYCWRVAEQ